MPRLNLPKVSYANGESYRTSWDRATWIKDKNGRLRWVDITNITMLAQWSPYTLQPVSPTALAAKKYAEERMAAAAKRDAEANAKRDEAAVKENVEKVENETKRVRVV